MKKITSFVLISFILTGCLTNSESYHVKDHDHWNERYYEESQNKEETNFAGYLMAIGAAAALVIAAGLEGTTR